MNKNQDILALCDHSNLYFFTFGIRSNKFLYTNRVFRILFKDRMNTPESLIDYLHPDDKELVMSSFEDCKSGKKVFDLEFRIVVENCIIWYKIAAMLTNTDPDGPTICCHAADITLNKTNIQILNQHNEKKNAILNILSHDLMAPIGIIESLSGLLQQVNQEETATMIEQYVTMIHNTSKKCIQLIRNFINVEFMESAAIELKKTRINLVTKLIYLVDEYQRNQKDMVKEFFISSSSKNVFANIDEDKFLQVINNLISNSLKFTRDNGKIAITVNYHNGAVLITISDDGIGIPEKYHTSLFDKFTPARRMGLRGEESHGLGMSIIKTIVEWHGGEIWFKSVENKGTTFFIQLPVE